jgi:hypothetical protein
MDADDTDLVVLAQSQEYAEFAYATEGVAEPADYDLVTALDMREHPPPLGAEFFLNAFFLNDVLAPECLHPGTVFITGNQVPRKEQITDFCHVSRGIVPLNYAKMLTRQMVLNKNLSRVPA